MREVRTKNRKTFTSTFFPVGGDIEAIVVDWISFLTKESLFSPDDPLFPATRVEAGKEGLFAAVGLNRVGWRNATAIRRIFQQAFERADLPYFNPHSFRKTLAALGEALSLARGVQGLEPKPGSREGLDDIHELRSVAGERQADILNAAVAARLSTALMLANPTKRPSDAFWGYLHKKAGPPSSPAQ